MPLCPRTGAFFGVRFMAGSQKFVDVRYARLLHGRGLQSWAIERPQDFLRKIELPE